MSSEGGSLQPPAGGGDKPPVKPVFSSFINKSGAGKKFGPKAVRRRPGAAASQAPAPAASAPTEAQKPSESEASTAPTAPTAESQAVSQPAPQPVPQPVLPTPTASQETTSQDASRQVQAMPQGPGATVETALQKSAVIESPEPTPDATNTTSALPDVEAELATRTGRPAEEELESGRSPKRQRLDTEVEEEPQKLSAEPPATVPETGHEDRQSTQNEIPIDPTLEQQTGLGQVAPNDTASSSALATEIDANTAVPIDGTLQDKPKRRRNLPWQAVNHPRAEDEGQAPVENGAETSTQTEPAKSKAKRKPRAVPRRGKRADNEDDLVEAPEGATAPPTTTRAKGRRKQAVADDAPEEEGPEGATVGRPATQQKKKRAVKKKKSETDSEKKDKAPSQRRRAEREQTPSDAEDQEIDKGTTFMDNLASRNIRVGQLSEREKKMREINWADIRQRQREEEALVIGAEAKEALNARLEDAAQAFKGPAETRPQTQLVDGQIVMVSDGGRQNRADNEDLEDGDVAVIQEDDITKRITSRSFMKNNKRNPTEFMLPGQGKRWNKEATEHFYYALSVFGTDFAMVATMFPNTTRRSIKTKFVREERENPDRIKKVLTAPRRESDWGKYLTHSGLTDADFADTDNIMKELEEEKARMQVQIDEAKEKAKEERRQRHAAGIFSDNEGEGGDKENGKKKGRKRGQQVETGFQLRPGEELVDEDELSDF